MTDTPTSPEERTTAWIATASALLMIAWQVGAKAARDAFFLTSFDVERLPGMVIGGALLSIAAIAPATRGMARLGPARFVPRAYFASALVTLGVWGVQHTAPALAAVLFYLQVAAMGALLVSGFWSVVNECFDPRAGKRYFVWFTRGATLGGLVGSVMADRAAEWLGVTAFLPVLAGIHLVLAGMVGRLEPRRPPPADAEEGGGLEVLRRQPYLRGLAALVVVITAGAGVVDYLFKAAASARYEGADLLQFFAWFYMAVGLGAVVLQAVVTRPLLRVLGVGRMAAVLPGTVAVGGAAALFVPGMGSAVLLRGVEQALRSSTHRLAYELLYVPVPRRDKRRVKALVDVGMDRAGDVLGALLVSGALFLLATPRQALLGIVVVLMLGAVGLAWRLDRGYLDALERSLRSQAGRLAVIEADGIMASLVSRVFGTGELTRVDLVRGLTGAVGTAGAAAEAVVPDRTDPVVRRVEALRSRDPEAVRAELARPLEAELVGHVIPLLAWDDVAREAIRALAEVRPRPTGQLLDALLEPDTPFAVRRRLPRAFVAEDGARGVAGLVDGLADPRFEVRYRCGQALVRLHRARPELEMPRQRIFDAVFAEARTARAVWASRTLIDEADDADLGDGRLRLDPSMRHVFSLLLLVLPAESLGLAFEALRSGDARLRGTALEYLEKVLPADVRRVLWPYLDPEPGASAGGRPAREVLDDLVRSHREIELDVERLRRAAAVGEE